MKKMINKIVTLRAMTLRIKIMLLVSAITLAGCEKVVDVKLNTETPRLVIDAAINWEKGTPGNLQTIKLTTTTSYTQQTIPTADGATVTVTNSANRVFSFTEVPNTGKYICTDFIPQLNELYSLKVLFKGETYTAEEKLIVTPSLKNVEQINDLGLNSDEIGIKINFKDTANQRNFYLLRTDFSEMPFPDYQLYDDRFSDGNAMTWFYFHSKLAKGKVLNFTQYGISENYSNYMFLLINASSGAGSGPFRVIPTRVRGNIINQTNSNNYAFGFFRLSEMTKLQYTIQ